MFVLLFAFVFGGAIPLPGTGPSYREFLMPGIFAQTIVFAAATTAIGMCRRHQQGDHRPLPLAADGALGRPHRADVLRRRLQRRHPGRADGHRPRRRLDASTTGSRRCSRGSGSCSCSPSRCPGSASGSGCRSRPSRSRSRCRSPSSSRSRSSRTCSSRSTTLPTWLQPIAEWNPTSTLTAALRDLWGNPNPYPSPTASRRPTGPRDAHLGRGDPRDLRAARGPPLPHDEPLTRCPGPTISGLLPAPALLAVGLVLGLIVLFPARRLQLAGFSARSIALYALCLWALAFCWPSGPSRLGSWSRSC